MATSYAPIRNLIEGGLISMELIDRYIYAVTAHLPESSRTEVAKELRANINDMLPENATESDVRDVLLELGNPAKLADEYNEVKRYLIGPNLYHSYFSVLKLVTGIVAIVLVITTLLDGILITPSNTGVNDLGITLFIDIILAVFQGIMQAFLWVTLIFAIMERTDANPASLPLNKKEWSPNDLPPLPMLSRNKISRVETIIALFGTVFITAILYFAPHLIGIYVNSGDGLKLIAPLFAVERLQHYIFIIILLALFNMCIIVYKLMVRHWNLSLAIANAIHNLLLSILVIVMIRDTYLFNKSFVLYFSDLLGITIPQMGLVWSNALTIFAVFFVATNLWDGVAGFIKYKK